MKADDLIKQVIEEDKQRRSKIYNQPEYFWINLRSKMKLDLVTAKYK